jgi:hypothetical protein
LVESLGLILEALLVKVYSLLLGERKLRWFLLVILGSTVLVTVFFEVLLALYSSLLNEGFLLLRAEILNFEVQFEHLILAILERLLVGDGFDVLVFL